MRVFHRRMVRQRIDADRSLHTRPTPRPDEGWVRTIREALGMSELELAGLMGITQQRVNQIQRAEVEQSIRLGTLGRVAEVLNCQLVYYLAPKEPLEDMVWRQAFAKAAEEVGYDPDDPEEDDNALHRGEEAEALTPDWVDRRGLWKQHSSSTVRPDAGQPPASAAPVPPAPSPEPSPGFP